MTVSLTWYRFILHDGSFSFYDPLFTLFSLSQPSAIRSQFMLIPYTRHSIIIVNIGYTAGNSHVNIWNSIAFFTLLRAFSVLYFYLDCRFVWFELCCVHIVYKNYGVFLHPSFWFLNEAIIFFFWGNLYIARLYLRLSAGYLDMWKKLYLSSIL